MFNLKDRSEDTMRKVYDSEKIDRHGKHTHKVLSTATAVFLFFGATASALAQTAFEGNLNSVSITDAAGTNSPPTANFTYTQNDNTFSFDASDSTDSDGSIVKYKWSFGNGTTSEGTTATYTLTDTSNLQVVLTVVDNNNGVALSQQTINSQNSITDDFSIDTIANYSPVSKTISISNGVATCPTWSSALAFHKTSTGNNNNFAQADVTFSNSNDFGGVVARWNPTNNTGYSVRLAGSSLRLYAHNGNNITLLGSYTANFSQNSTYAVKITVNGSTIKGFVDGVQRISVTNSLYSKGENIGIIVSRGYGGTSSADNFIGGSL